MKILIADDDAVSRTILRRAIEKFGHECLAAEDGEKAWRLYEENLDVDVIISDWMMPNVDGLELCRRVRSADRECYTYFIFLTALGDKEHLLMGMEAGGDDYLTKPLDRDELQVRLISASRVTSLHRRLFEQAREDSLTGLGNRLRLREDVKTLIGQAERYGHSYCLLLCDIDYFKLYNDHYGHLAGDEALRAVAKIIQGHCRSGDAAYRFGGEEFLVILPEQNPKTAKITAERLRIAVEDLRVEHEKSPFGVVTVSVGVAGFSAEEDSTRVVGDLLQKADGALYLAKQAGRNHVASHEMEGS